MEWAVTKRQLYSVFLKIISGLPASAKAGFFYDLSFLTVSGSNSQTDKLHYTLEDVVRLFINSSLSDVMTFITRILTIVFMLSAAGCARTYQARYVDTTDFLGDYSMLKEGRDDDALLSYWKDRADWPHYKKVIVDPVVVRKTRDSGLNDRPQIESNRLKELFEHRVREALKKDFKLVNKPGPDTMRVQLAITDAETSTLLLDQFTTLYPSARASSLLKHIVLGTESFVGKASIERKVTDSSTGELLMASADCRAGGKTLEGSFNEWDDVEQAYMYWAQQLSYQLCEKARKSNCLPPD